MELEVVKKLIKKYTAGHGAFLPRPILRIGIIGTRRISYWSRLRKEKQSKERTRCGMQITGSPSTSTVSWSIRKRPICLQRRLCSIWAIRHLIKH